MVSDAAAEVQHISLIDSLNGEWLKLPLAVMRDCGPAVQTLGGVLKITNKETFMAVSEIASRARLPKRTAEKHLATLAGAGWIARLGRQRTRGGRLRRTATIKVTKATRDSVKRLESDGEMKYGILPWWACCRIRNLHGQRGPGTLPWSARAVLSVVMARLCSLKAGVENQEGEEVYDCEDFIGAIENLGGDDRFRFSLNRLETATGLHRESIVSAKQLLHKTAIVVWQGDHDEHGGAVTDVLYPNWEFTVVETPTPQGGVWLDFHRGSENG